MNGKRNLLKSAGEVKLKTAELELAGMIERHQQAMTRLAFRLVGNAEDAKDLAQWAFARLWLNRNRLDSERNAFFYLRKLLVNLCIDHLRQRGQREPQVEFIEERFSSEMASPLQQIETQEVHKELLRCIDALKPKQKATMILRDVEGYSVEETAAILDCTKNNVLCNLHLARENVRRKMQVWLTVE